LFDLFRCGSSILSYGRCPITGARAKFFSIFTLVSSGLGLMGLSIVDVTMLRFPFVCIALVRQVTCLI